MGVFAGTVKAFTAHKEGDRVGWISSPATHQLYASDVYVHGSMIEGFGHGDVVSFAVHVNNKGKPQACNGTVARLAQATGCTTGGAIDMTVSALGTVLPAPEVSQDEAR